jgi:hypothetical protein
MIQFFQILFFTAAVILIVLNVVQFNKYWESKKIKMEGHPPVRSIKWFNFILTSLVAIGCILNIVIKWITKA